MSPTDLVIVLPGIMGSTLALNGQLVWAPSAGAVLRAVKTLGRSVRQMQLPDGIGDDHPGDGVQPVSLMPDLHLIPGLWTPINGYDRLLARLDRLRQTGEIGKVVPAPYDWRLSNRYNAKQLEGLVADELGRWRDSDLSRRHSEVVFVCHSMGGLVARWYIEHCGGAEVTRKLITIGTPYRGAAKSAYQLLHGVRKQLGPIALDLTDFARSLPSIHQLLPDYACVEDSGVLRRLDEIAVPGIDQTMLHDGLAFHTALAGAEHARPASLADTHAIVGTRQPTATTLTSTFELCDTIDSENDYGDTTVPLTGAIGHNLDLATNRVVRVVEGHGNLQNHPAVLDEIESIITARPVRRRRPSSEVQVRVAAPELLVVGEPLQVTVDIEAHDHRVPAVQLQLVPDHVPGTRVAAVATVQPRIRNNQLQATFQPQNAGAYTLRVTGTSPSSPITPVTHTSLVWG